MELPDFKTNTFSFLQLSYIKKFSNANNFCSSALSLNSQI